MWFFLLAFLSVLEYRVSNETYLSVNKVAITNLPIRLMVLRQRLHTSLWVNCWSFPLVTNEDTLESLPNKGMQHIIGLSQNTKPLCLWVLHCRGTWHLANCYGSSKDSNNSTFTKSVISFQLFFSPTPPTITQRTTFQNFDLDSVAVLTFKKCFHNQQIWSREGHMHGLVMA